LLPSAIPTKTLWHCRFDERSDQFCCANWFDKRPGAYRTPIHHIELWFGKVHQLFGPSPNRGMTVWKAVATFRHPAKGLAQRQAESPMG
jgi:hypothetical protein